MWLGTESVTVRGVCRRPGRGATPTQAVRGVCIRKCYTSPRRLPQVMHHNALLTRENVALVVSGRPKAIQRLELCLSFRRHRIRDCAYGMMCLDQLSEREGQCVVYNSERNTVHGEVCALLCASCGFVLPLSCRVRAQLDFLV